MRRPNRHSANTRAAALNPAAQPRTVFLDLLPKNKVDPHTPAGQRQQLFGPLLEWWPLPQAAAAARAAALAAARPCTGAAGCSRLCGTPPLAGCTRLLRAGATAAADGRCTCCHSGRPAAAVPAAQLSQHGRRQRRARVACTGGSCCLAGGSLQRLQRQVLKRRNPAEGGWGGRVATRGVAE